MFTGLIQCTGRIKRVSRGAGLVLEVAADDDWARPLEEGESVAVNGVCLTVVRCEGRRFTADVLKETEARSGLGELMPGARVNLERALRAGDPMGGHIVQGHVDTRGTVMEKIARGRDFRLKVRCGRVIAAQSVEKGSIAINGVSLTISALGEDWLCADIIPTTAQSTTLGELRAGDRVNLESDIVGKFLKKEKTGLTIEALQNAGFI